MHKAELKGRIFVATVWIKNVLQLFLAVPSHCPACPKASLAAGSQHVAHDEAEWPHDLSHMTADPSSGCLYFLDKPSHVDAFSEKLEGETDTFFPESIFSPFLVPGESTKGKFVIYNACQGKWTRGVVFLGFYGRSTVDVLQA